MSNRYTLLAAVAARPDDDLPRLVYADWLDEHGEDRQAAFIRRQIENAAAVRDTMRSFAAAVLPDRHKGEGFTALLRVEPWNVWKQHVSPVLAVTASRHSYGRCIAWHRGFPAVVSCTARQWHGCHRRFPVPPERVCLANAGLGEWGAFVRDGAWWRRSLIDRGVETSAAAGEVYAAAWPGVGMFLRSPCSSHTLRGVSLRFALGISA